MTVSPSIFYFVRAVQARPPCCACSGETCHNTNNTTLPIMLPSVSRIFFQRANPADQEQHKKLFVDNKLAITEDPRFEKEFARYPVLYVDFSVSK